MPTIWIAAAGASCLQYSLDLQLHWQDPVTGVDTSYDSGTFYMKGHQTIPWYGPSGWPNLSGDLSEGGYGSIVYQVNGGAPQYFYFNVGGCNTSSNHPPGCGGGNSATVDEFYGPLIAGPPPAWFWGNILAQESSGRQYDTSISSPLSDPPLVISNPDGIGISQIEGTVHLVAHCDYWNFECNIEDGTAILYGTQKTAYSYYAGLVGEYGSPTLTSSNDGDPLDYCAFASSASGNVHSWEDAEWITTYNGTGGVKCSDGSYQYPPGYYLQWSPTLGYYINKVSNPICGTHGSYVGDVCNEAGY